MRLGERVEEVIFRVLKVVVLPVLWLVDCGTVTRLCKGKGRGICGIYMIPGYQLCLLASNRSLDRHCSGKWFHQRDACRRGMLSSARIMRLGELQLGMHIED